MSIESALSDLTGPLPSGIAEGVALGAGVADGYDLHETVIGDVMVAFNTEGVSSVDLADDGFEERHLTRFGRSLIRAEAPSAWAGAVPAALEAGRPGKLPIDLRAATPFQADVLHATAAIPRGEVRPYAWLTAEVRRPKAARAAGSAVARNPIPLIIPCHRVVRSDGRLGGYSLGGPHHKRRLLESEEARPDWLEGLASRRVRVRGDDAAGLFHHPTCRLIRRSAAVVDFGSADEAREAGLSACGACRPRE